MGAPDGKGLLGKISGLLIAAVVLGLGYNSFSPLGVRAATDGGPGPTATAPAGGSYANETLVLNTQPAAEAARNQHGLQNETLAVEINGAPVVAGPGAPVPQQLPPALTWAEVKPLLARGEAVLVDAREPAAYDAGHIPGAVSLPFTQLSQRIAVFAAAYAKNRPLIVYCASSQCPVSQAEAQQLQQQFGFTNVREMPGGYAEWRQAESAAQAAGQAGP